MKKIFILFSLLLAIIISLLFVRESSTSSEQNEVEGSSSLKGQGSQPKPAVTSYKNTKTSIERKKSLEEQKTTSFKAQNEREQAAEILSIIFKKYSSGSTEISSAELLDDLIAIDLEPIRSLKETGNSGSFAIVRTKNSLKGTRYFHAQFFSDDNGKEYLQHMSFEMGPKEPFARVRELAKSYLASKVISEISKPDYQLWKMENGYNVWVKTLSKEDLQDDPFNAYTEDDIGIKRIVIEEEIHPDNESDHND